MPRAKFHLRIARRFRAPNAVKPAHIFVTKRRCKRSARLPSLPLGKRYKRLDMSGMPFMRWETYLCCPTFRDSKKRRHSPINQLNETRP